ncbi:MAG TPA: zf-HC2 domain-containing protein [Longimicrobiaceae bacterium]|nr:zf-HC2 domain-containing protein [Longimicrobiaceae bacterium]
MPYSYGHVPLSSLELFVEDALPPEERDEVQEHVRQCGYCAAELEACRAFLASLAQLPDFDPSPGFADAVMARVIIRPRTSPALTRVRQWLPATRRGWMMLWTALLAPLTPLVAVAAWLLSHPLVSAGGLWSMGQRWAVDAAESVGAGVAGLVAQSGIWGWGQDVVAAVWQNPFGLLSLTVLFMALATPVSAWSLVRLLRTPMGGMTHAN